MLNKHLTKFYKLYILKHPLINKFVIRLIKYKRIKNSIKKKIKGKNNILNINNSILLDVNLDIRGDNNTINIGNLTVLRNVNFFIRGDNHIIDIGNKSLFSRGSLIWMEDNNGYLKIGNNVLIEDVHFAITEPFSKIIVDDNCMFSYNIDIRTGDSHSIIDNITQKRINYAKNIHIKEHVWIAAHCNILKGVSIAKNSIIGTSAVVSKSIQEEGTISVGNPSKIVKKNINWDIKRIYE